jgi:hypothetical protein
MGAWWHVSGCQRADKMGRPRPGSKTMPRSRLRSSRDSPVAPISPHPASVLEDGAALPWRSIKGSGSVC